MASDRPVDNFIERTLVSVFLMPWWVSLLLGAGCLVTGVLPFWDESGSLSIALTMLVVSVWLLWGLCFMAAGLINRFSPEPLIHILRTQWWAGFLFGFSLFLMGVIVLWNEAEGAWSKTSLLLMPGNIILSIGGLVVAFGGGRMIVAGIINIFSKKLSSSEPPGANPAGHGADAPRQ